MWKKVRVEEHGRPDQRPPGSSHGAPHHIHYRKASGCDRPRCCLLSVVENEDHVDHQAVHCPSRGLTWRSLKSYSVWVAWCRHQNSIFDIAYPQRQVDSASARERLLCNSHRYSALQPLSSTHIAFGRHRLYHLLKARAVISWPCLRSILGRWL